MNKLILFYFISLLLLSSCIGFKAKVQMPKPLQLTNVNLSFTEIQPLEYGSAWAKRAERKHIQFLQITLSNPTNEQITVTNKNLEVYGNLERIKVYSYKKCYRKLNNSHLPGVALIGLGSVAAQKKTSYDYYENGIHSKGFSLEYKFNAGTGLLYAAGGAYLFGSINGNINLNNALKPIYLHNKTLAPGDTITGIIAIKQPEKQELMVRLKN